MVLTLALIPAWTHLLPLVRPCGPLPPANSFRRFPNGSSLPRGEGEWFAGSLKCRAAEIAGASSAIRRWTTAVPSPWGEGQGEGGRENKLQNSGPFNTGNTFKTLSVVFIIQKPLQQPNQQRAGIGTCQIKLFRHWILPDHGRERRD